MTQYPSRFDPTKKYQRVLYPDQERHAHSQDFNDAQAILDARIKSVASIWTKDGAVIDGASINVNRTTGAVQMSAGKVFADGYVHDVAERKLTIPIDRVVRVGICVASRPVTYLEDPQLRGGVPGTRAYGEPSADRLQITATWTADTLGECQGSFYSVYTIINGEVLTADPPTDPLDERLARYDRERNGHYIVKGWDVTALGYNAPDDTQHFSISEGVINVWGYKRERTTSFRLRVPEQADLLRVESEPHLVPAGVGNIRILANHGPIKRIRQVTVLRQRTVNMTHGAFSGAQDPLPHQSVAAITSCSQGGVTYTQGVDYVLTSDSVDWRAVAVREPAPGSTYSVTYQYFDAGDPVASDDESFTITDVVAGSLAILDYDWALPRIDSIAVDRDGQVQYFKGTADPYRPAAPKIPLDMLAIANVTNKWGRTPTITSVGTRAVLNNRLELHDNLIFDLYDLVAQERLKRNMDSRQPTTKRGVFVDPLFDDDMRDQGLEQTAAIVNEALVLPILTNAETHTIQRRPITLNWTEELLIEQSLSTGSMKVNPYQAFAPIPANVHLDPALDHWTEFNSIWLSPETRTIELSSGAGNAASRSLSTRDFSVEQQTARVAATTIRVGDVMFEIEGFGSGEQLNSVTFDGVAVDPRPVFSGETYPQTELVVGKGPNIGTAAQHIQAGISGWTYAGSDALYNGVDNEFGPQADGVAAGSYVGQNFNTQERLFSVDFWNDFGANNALRSASLVASNNGTNWTVIASRAGIPNSTLVTFLVPPITPAYQYWAVRADSTPEAGSSINLVTGETTALSAGHWQIRETRYYRAITNFQPGDTTQTMEIQRQNAGPMRADSQGKLRGLIRIPSGLPVGAKHVEFIGAGGTTGSAVYVGSGEITTQLLRAVTTETFMTTRWWQGRDPLAETFTPPRSCHVAGADIKFAAIGDRNRKCVLQIREVALGLPTANVIAEANINMHTVQVGVWTHVSFTTPAPILREGEYAIVVLTDDGAHALAIASLGDFDPVLQRYVTQQAYQIGVLLSSSNASTWTPHQNSDMSFRLYAAKFTEQTHEVPVPQNFQLRGCTDLLFNIGTDEPTSVTTVAIKVQRPDGTSFLMRPGVPVIFEAPRTEMIIVSVIARSAAEDAGSADITHSPIIYPWIQMVQGTIQGNGTYITRAMPGGDATNPVNAVCTIDCFTPGASTVTVEIGQDGAWSPMTLSRSTPLGDGVVERSYTKTGYTAADARIRIKLSGSTNARPEVRQIRANVTADPINVITGA